MTKTNNHAFNSKAFISKEINATIDLLSAMASDVSLLNSIDQVAHLCVDAFKRGNKLLFAGNGGSAADSQHLAAEFVSRFYFDRPGLPAIAVTTDTSILTAVGNDYGYECLFARQVQALGVKGDIFFGISTSGNSPNILAGLKQAKELGIVTVGLTGSKGGKMVELCDYCLRMPSAMTPKIQEGHINVGHIICGIAEELMFGQKPSLVAVAETESPVANA